MRLSLQVRNAPTNDPFADKGNFQMSFPTSETSTSDNSQHTSFKQACPNASPFDKTLLTMMQNSTNSGMKIDGSDHSYLNCTTCNYQERVVDSGNDMSNQGSGKDLIQTLLKQKCRCCDKFNCQKCLDECGECEELTRRLCLSYYCDPERSIEAYVCANCKYQ